MKARLIPYVRRCVVEIVNSLCQISEEEKQKIIFEFVDKDDNTVEDSIIKEDVALIEAGKGRSHSKSISYIKQDTTPQEYDIFIHKDIAYYTEKDAHAKHKLNVYVPQPKIATKAKYPIVLHIHGGGWQRGDR
jgi:acetyl esterase/lipase